MRQRHYLISDCGFAISDCKLFANFLLFSVKSVIKISLLIEFYMKHISIIVTKGAILGNIEGPRQVFTEANQFLERTGKSAFFKVDFVSLSEKKLN